MVFMEPVRPLHVLNILFLLIQFSHQKENKLDLGVVPSGHWRPEEVLLYEKLKAKTVGITFKLQCAVTETPLISIHA